MEIITKSLIYLYLFHLQIIIKEKNLKNNARTFYSSRSNQKGGSWDNHLEASFNGDIYFGKTTLQTET